MIDKNINPIEASDIHIFINDGDMISTPFSELYYITQLVGFGNKTIQNK